jgi:hypothetical protein
LSDAASSSDYIALNGRTLINELETTVQEAVVAELEGLYGISMEEKTSVRPVSGQMLKTRIFHLQRISTEYST